ncbi:MAG: polysaccharide deacetylase family protein [Hyphomicrobiaceae bacterium]
MPLLPDRLVLNFHGLGEPERQISDSERRYWLAASVFAETLAVAAELEHELGIRLAFTFDDGNISDIRIAAPLLLQHGRPATFFVLADRIGTEGSLAIGDLRDLAAAGFAIGSHGAAHVPWTKVAGRDLHREIVEARERIAAAAGAGIASASAPFGLFDRPVVAAVRAAGFARLMTSSGGLAVADDGLVPRVSVKAGFDPRPDIAALAWHGLRIRSALRDRARRWRYAGRWTSSTAR